MVVGSKALCAQVIGEITALFHKQTPQGKDLLA
jgi:hypothetical protein